MVDVIVLRATTTTWMEHVFMLILDLKNIYTMALELAQSAP